MVRTAKRYYAGNVDEGWKVLIGTFAGFVAGLLGETVKFPLLQRLKRRQLRHALYKDLALIRISLKASENHYQHEHRLETKRLDAFDYFYNTERATFYQLQESHILAHLYELIRLYAKEEDQDEAQHLLGATMMSLHMNIESGALDGRLLEHYEDSFIRYTVIHSERLHREPGSRFRGLLRRRKSRSPEDELNS